MNQVPVDGYSVTIPHKQKILRYLDQVDPVARRIGATSNSRRMPTLRSLRTVRPANIAEKVVGGEQAA